MAQFDVHAHPEAKQREATPYLVQIQSDLLDELGLALVAPLRRTAAFKPVWRLHPTFTVMGEKLCLVTTEITSIPAKRLGPTVANLKDERQAILGAVEVLLKGV